MVILETNKNIILQNHSVLVLPTNTEGIWETPEELLFKTTFPYFHHYYRIECCTKKVGLNLPLFTHHETKDLLLIALPVKTKQKRPSNIKLFQNSLIELGVVISRYNIQTLGISLPKEFLGLLQDDVLNEFYTLDNTFQNEITIHIYK